jgi:hypothetical protein
MGRPGRLGQKIRLCLALAVGCGIGSSGCTRQYFRKHADEEVGEVLVEKDKYPAWKIEQWHVYPDPRARFGDPTNPDRPPKPPDDPAAYDLSPNPQRAGKAGVERVEGTGYLDLLAAWDAENRAEAAAASGKKEKGATSGTGPGEKPQGPPKEKPPAGPIEKLSVAPKEVPQEDAQEKPAAPAKEPIAVTAALTTSLTVKPKPGERSPYLLKLEQAVQLGLINSREYQDAREDLYLTALPVITERFAFAAQFFAIGQAIREWAGRQTPEGHQDNWTLNSNAGFTKLFSTGALLLFNFANQTVFNFTGAGHHLTSQSTMNLDVVQPLLQGGGRAVALEPLTQAERNLLYQIRNYVRFQKEFYVAIAGGGGGSITGSAFQPVGVIAASTFSPNQGIGNSGLVPGLTPLLNVASALGLQVNPGSSGRISLQTPLAAQVSGYLTTLLQSAQLHVDEYNIQKLEGFLALSKAMEEGGDVSELQVQQFEQSLLRGRTALLTDQQQYLLSLDQFKLQLGLPIDLSIELDDTPFRPLNRQFQRYEALFREFTEASNAPLRFAGPDMVDRVRKELLRIFTTSSLVSGTRFGTRIEASWPAWEKLTTDQLQKRLESLGAENRRLLDRKTDLETKGQTLSPGDQQRMNELEFEITLGGFERVLREYEAQPWKKVLEPQVGRRRQQLGFRYVVNAFINVLTEARNERLELLRHTWPDLAKLCVNGVDLLKADLHDAEGAVIQAGLTNRLDLMNVRAQLVDAWRQLAVYANALLGVFNVQYHMDTSTPAGLAQPLAFSASRTRHELLLNTELPLVRMTEQNNYRASLINYQRARRIVMRAEDQVAFDTRNELRQLRQQEENYRIQQRQVELGYLTVENSLDTFQAPPAPLPAGQQPPDVATRAAALANQLIMAQTNLYNAQFAMTTIWITYLNTRLQLYRDMELMPLDYRGVWIDEVDTQCPRSDAAGSSESGRCCPATEPRSDGAERPEQHAEPHPVPPAQGPPVEQAR